MTSKRTSRNIAGLKQVQMTGTTPNHGTKVFSSIRAAQLTTSKSALPAEFMVRILDYLSIPDLVTCARVSQQFQEMVYEDARWVQKLRAMGAWNEGDARQNFEQSMRRKVETQQQRTGRHNEALGVSNVQNTAGQGPRRHTGSVTMFDAGIEEERLRQLSIRDEHRSTARRPTDGFEEVPSSPVVLQNLDPKAALIVLDQVRSIRGRAKHEFGKVYAVLGPLYLNLVRANNQAEALVFRAYQSPEDQAQILSALTRFAQHDTATGAEHRLAKLAAMVTVFEQAVLREFEAGIVERDVDRRMKRYAHVLCTLNGGQSGIDLFLSLQPVFQRTLRLGSPLDCLEDVAPGHLDLNASQRFFELLIKLAQEQSNVIQRSFPDTVDVLTPFLRRLCSEILSDYVTTLADEAHARGRETYVKAVSGCFGQAMQFASSLRPTTASGSGFEHETKAMVTACFEKHIDLYLAEELSLFKARSQAEIDEFDKQASEQQATAESYFMSNVSRQAAKRDFLSSFRKVVMMPVNAFPSPFASSKPVAHKSAADLASVDTAYTRSSSPALSTSIPGRVSTPRLEAPTTELAAKTAIMNSRLEGIKSLFSIDVALNLTHAAKASLERAAIITKMGGKFGESAVRQCELIFVELLHILGSRHVREGFDKAVTHLSTYDPRQVREYRAKFASDTEDSEQVAGVEPLMTFLELVNVGDLIQQMIDVFYNEELLSKRLTEQDDFLSPAVKEKKRFEQMLDERVAAGLSKGIDVLMDEVEFLCATTQPATDFNPVANAKTAHPAALDIDIGPSNTAKQIIDIVSSHTSMLVGSTDKTMLDVFMQEVGLRLFGVLCKHIKRQRISVDGAIKLISDVNHYAAYITSLRQKQILPYFSALRELGQIYLVYIDPPVGVFGSGSGKDAKRGSLLSMKATKTQLQAKELATIIADNQRYYGIFPAEEVYEFAERRADWYLVKSDVERAMYGAGCSIM